MENDGLSGRFCEYSMALKKLFRRVCESDFGKKRLCKTIIP